LSLPGDDMWYAPSITLPPYIKDVLEATNINDILRYKFGLVANVGQFGGFLGSGVDDNSPFSARLNPVLETILKQFQALSFKGAHFEHKTNILAIADFMEDNTKFTDPNEAAIAKENLNMSKTQVKMPWPNFKLELFLAALINENYFNLDLDDVNLGAYDTTIPNTLINNYINKNINPNLNEEAKKTLAGDIITALPNQIKALIMNNINTTTLNSSMKYLSDIPSVEGVYGKDNKSLHIDQYGKIWLDHFNLVEVEVFNGYKTYDMSQATNLVKYESLYNSVVNDPTWVPLNTAVLNNLQQGNGVLLCRLKKYKNSLYNSESYNLLDLPVYDTYFFIKPNDYNNESSQVTGISEDLQFVD